MSLEDEIRGLDDLHDALAGLPEETRQRLNQIVRAAVDTARRQGFERGASPSVQVLLAEIQKIEGGDGAADYAQGVLDGMVHAVQILTAGDVARYHSAFLAGQPND